MVNAHFSPLAKRSTAASRSGRRASNIRILACLTLGSAVIGISGCETAENRPHVPTLSSRAQAVQEAERKRAEQQGEQAASNAAHGAGQPRAETPAQYLPPSERGADVEITEKRLDGRAPPVASKATAVAPSAGGAAPPRGASATPASRPAAGNAGQTMRALNKPPAGTRGTLSTTAATAAVTPRAGGTGAREAPPTGRGAGGVANTASGLGNTPDHSGSAPVAVKPYPQSHSKLIDESDHSNDDIVARQLREAANRESDPVLKEKLWDEYRNYKRGLGS